MKVTTNKKSQTQLRVRWWHQEYLECLKLLSCGDGRMTAVTVSGGMRKRSGTSEGKVFKAVRPSGCGRPMGNRLVGLLLLCVNEFIV